jgi:hypothetical protein
VNLTGVFIMLAIPMIALAPAPPAAFAGLAPNAEPPPLAPAADAPAAAPPDDAAAPLTIEYAA